MWTKWTENWQKIQKCSLVNCSFSFLINHFCFQEAKGDDISQHTRDWEAGRSSEEAPTGQRDICTMFEPARWQVLRVLSWIIEKTDEKCRCKEVRPTILRWGKKKLAFTMHLDSPAAYKYFRSIFFLPHARSYGNGCHLPCLNQGPSLMW